MGKRRTRTTQTNRPIYSGQIEGAASNVANAYTQAQPAINATANSLGQVSQDLFTRFQNGGDPAQAAASDYIVRTLGDSGEGNPFLDRMVADTSDSLARRIRTGLGTRGGIGGSVERDIVSGNLADSELAMRYADFDRRRQLQANAAGMAPGISAAGYLPVQMGAQLGAQGAMLPLQAGALNAASIGGLLGQYQDVRGTQVQSGGLLGQILSSAAQAGMSAAMACDIRLKENIEWIGLTPAGLPVYKFDYIGGARGVIGPMAQEVAIMQPEALGPVIDGYMTVIPEALQ